LEQLIDNAVYALIEEVNSQKIPVYQEETEEKSSTFQAEREIEVINNFTINSILKERLLTILKEIQEIIDHYPKVISKGE